MRGLACTFLRKPEINCFWLSLKPDLKVEAVQQLFFLNFIFLTLKTLHSCSSQVDLLKAIWGCVEKPCNTAKSHSIASSEGFGKSQQLQERNFSSGKTQFTPMLLQEGAVPLLTSALSHTSYFMAPHMKLCGWPDHLFAPGMSYHSVDTREPRLTQGTDRALLSGSNNILS